MKPIKSKVVTKKVAPSAMEPNGRPRLPEIGVTGLKVEGGKIVEEWNAKLKDRRGILAYKEMSEQEPTVVTALHHIEMIIGRVQWRLDLPEGVEDDARAEEVRDFVESCRKDLSHPWSEFVSEAARGALAYGWHLAEIVYKIRGGPNEQVRERKSKYSDGRIGWRKFAVRSQETLDEWLFDDDQEPTAMVQRSESERETFTIPLEKAMLFRYRPTKGNPEGRSVLRGAWKPYFYLKRFQESEAIGCERDHTGMPIYELPPDYLGPGATAEQVAIRDYVGKVVKSMAAGERMGAVLPSEFNEEGGHTGHKFRLMASPGTKIVDADKVIRRYQSDIAMVLITEFALLGRDGAGSWALDDGKQTRFGLFLEGVLTMLSDIIQRAIDSLCAINGFDTAHIPVLKFGEVKAADLTALSAFLTAAHQVDLLDPDDDLRDWVRTTAKLPARRQDVDPITGDPLPYARDSSLPDLMAAIKGAIDQDDYEMANVLRRALARKLDAEIPEDLEEPEEPPAPPPGAPVPGAPPTPGAMPPQLAAHALPKKGAPPVDPEADA